ncbi:Hypothetical predicted protein, partial [Paramuricea clavata]
MLEETKDTLIIKACNVLLKDTYVDDITSGADSIEDALALQSAIMEVLASAGFKAKKWCSNSNHFLHGLDPDQRAPTTVRSLGSASDTVETFDETKTLG